MENKLLLLTAILLLIPSFVSASIQNFDVEVRIVSSRALLSYDIQTDQPSIQLNLPEDAKISEISETNYSLKDGILISSVSPGNLKLSYFTDMLIEKTSKSYFTSEFKFPVSEKINVRLILPEGSVIDSAFPTPEFTSDGKHIILSWNPQLKEKEGFPVFVIYKEASQIIWPWFIALIIASIAIAIFLKRKKQRAKVRLKKPAEKEIHLLESESAVIKVLKKAKGEVWQKQIQINTGFSKAKLSRLIRNLEARGLIKKIPLGNTNKIKLK
jgi:uncharacterized membrane protein